MTEVRFDWATFEDTARFEGATFQRGADFTGVTFLGEARFDGATFQDTAQFTRATFQDTAWFEGATFQGEAQFTRATFQDGGTFQVTITRRVERAELFKLATFEDGATFLAKTRFFGATFERAATFHWATFHGDAEFDGATFQSAAGFQATFQSMASFGGAIFQGQAWFAWATFQDFATFGQAIFQGDAEFVETIFQDSAWFNGATFERARSWVPCWRITGLGWMACSWPAGPDRGQGARLWCRRSRFPSGVQFRSRWADVLLDDTDFPAPSLLTGIPRLGREKVASAEQQIARVWEQQHSGRVSEQPRLLSLRRANVAGLGLGKRRSGWLPFSGAHNLDTLRLEADVAFKPSPVRLGWEQRQVIAEECTWRARRYGQWADPWWPDPDEVWSPENLEKPMALAPGTIADLYRALRKSREDAKDEPGAADFYYGEMEMRRHAHRRMDQGDSRSRLGRVDRGVVTAYWLVSGYGLRAWRALAWLVGITMAFALAFHLIGFTHPPQPATYWTSMLYAFRSTISLTDDVILTAWGQLLQALLRLTGPVLLGLALLALGNRVKR